MREHGPPVLFGPLGDSTGFLLRLAGIEAMARFFAPPAPVDIRAGEMSILMLVHANPGIRQGLLATALRIRRAHMTRTVQAMTARGLLATATPPDDRRSVTLTLSAEGEALIARWWAAIDAREKAPPPGLTGAEAAELRRLLRRLLAMPEPGETA